MKEVSRKFIVGPGFEQRYGGDAETKKLLSELSSVAQSFVQLQQARHEADYNLEKPLDPADAESKVNLANAAFVAWERTSHSEFAREYMFSLLFKERSQ